MFLDIGTKKDAPEDGASCCYSHERTSIQRASRDYRAE